MYIDSDRFTFSTTPTCRLDISVPTWRRPGRVDGVTTPERELEAMSSEEGVGFLRMSLGPSDVGFLRRVR